MPSPRCHVGSHKMFESNKMELNQLLVITLILLSSSDGRPSSSYGLNDVHQDRDPNGPNFGKIGDIVMNAVNSLKPNHDKVSDYVNNAFNSLKPTESDDSGSSYRPEESGGSPGPNIEEIKELVNGVFTCLPGLEEGDGSRYDSKFNEVTVRLKTQSNH